MTHEHHSAFRMMEVERESESRARSMIKGEELVQMRSSLLSLEMSLSQQPGMLLLQAESNRRHEGY